MVKVFLDDIRFPDHVWRDTIDPDYECNSEWVIVRDYNSFVAFISEHGLPDLISFDHDLVMDHYREVNQKNIIYENMIEMTGYHAAKWLISYCAERNLSLPKCKVHSMNPEGRKNIESILGLN